MENKDPSSGCLFCLGGVLGENFNFGQTEKQRAVCDERLLLLFEGRRVMQ